MKKQKFWKWNGSGYQTLILVCQTLLFYTKFERQKKLRFAQKPENPSSSKFQSFGDSFAGLPLCIFDKSVTCGAEILPTELLKQLKIGGKMVIPMGKTDEQILYRFTKISETEFEKKNLESINLLPMLSNNQ